MVEIVSSIEAVAGFKAAGVHCGLKKDDRLDLALIVSDRSCAAAGVFTTNQLKAAPVRYDQELLRRSSAAVRAVVVNTGSANACTGPQGYENARAMAQCVAERMGYTADETLVLSTGVIGVQLPMDKIRAGIAQAAGALGDNWQAAAQAIMTTDTRPKLASVTMTDASGVYQIAGIAKGAGMIAPNMATMLGVIVTDAVLSPSEARAALSASVAVSYNRILVDGDMSPNDTVLLLANGASGTKPDMDAFQQALTALCTHLAQAIVRDGEGATKFIALEVRRATDDTAARQIAHTIATSALVKTAFYGNDANWGRIIAAAGRSGAPFDPSRAQLQMASIVDGHRQAVLLFDAGVPADYSEALAAAIIGASDVQVTLDCGLGSGEATVWTCDLSHDYVTINGAYRT
ncbi:MAG: bifunctional glutamate N-acetyltransferase/amino-acid acetyltransferase ArgJ [Aggregatilineales bacterium]